ncbi:hypothetical protein ABS768_04900 [Flavobacterium sp. ST-75]|uniref:Uncharacterized protein n=1 Tax=Flavobacterium rhizophilum TaxID=3163296 RepID=A0ABW8YBX3_9FLAO
MKKYIQFIVLLLSINSFSQPSNDLKDQEANTEIEENYNYLNQYQINEVIEETKRKIEDLENNKAALEKYLVSLNSLKNEAENLKDSFLNEAIEKIRSSITAHNEAQIYQDETIILDELNKQYQTLYDIETNSESRNLMRLIYRATQELYSESVIREIEKTRYENKKPILTTESKLDNFKQKINSLIPKINTNLNLIIDNEIKTVTQKIEKCNSELKGKKGKLTDLFQQMEEKETQINSLSIKLGLPLFCLTILLLFLGPALLKNKKNKDGIEYSEGFSQNVVLEISTVLLLTMSILILGLSGKVNSEVLGTLIGGISGYVLNKVRTNSTASNS